MADHRRHKGEGSIYQRASDGRWVGVVDLGWVGGKRVRKTVTAPTLRELRPKLKTMKGQIERGIITDESTVAQWMREWLENIASKKVRDRTLVGYRGYVEQWIVPTLGKVRLRDLRPDHVRAMHRAMADAGRSDATQRQAHMILQRAMKVAEQEGKILRNPCSGVDAPRVGTVHHAALDMEQARALLRWTDQQDARTRARMGAALLMGLRQGEALGLRWDDVDLAAGEVYVHQSLARVAGVGLRIGPVKSTASDRYVPMDDPTRLAFLDWHAESGGVGLVFGGESMADPRADWQWWKDALRGAGVPDVPLHGARATCASILDALGFSPRLVADILGHGSVMVTQKHYARSYSDQRRAAVSAAARELRA